MGGAIHHDAAADWGLDQLEGFRLANGSYGGGRVQAAFAERALSIADKRLRKDIGACS
jgi:hypothetical protein